MATKRRSSTIDVAPCADLEEFGQAVFAIGQYFALEPTEDEALAIVQASLGGEVVAKQDGAGTPWVCPPLRHRLSEIHNHFFMMHGVYTKSGPGSKSVEKLLEQHREDHLTDPHASHAWVEHIHKEIP